MSVNPSVHTRNMEEIASKTGSVYESVSIISKRSRQISAKLKDELNSKLAEFASTVDNLEEIFENREQIEISKFYERMPKPTILATEEFVSDELLARQREEEEESEL
ncbi:MAG: DNA-directed RNA polymerase subunit omega [Bacteroidota bacterium]